MLKQNQYQNQDLKKQYLKKNLPAPFKRIKIVGSFIKSVQIRKFSTIKFDVFADVRTFYKTDKENYCERNLRSSMFRNNYFDYEKNNDTKNLSLA